MASLRTNPGYAQSTWLAAFLVAVVLGGSLVYSQVVPGLAAPEPPPEQVVQVRVVGNSGLPRDKILPHVHTRAGRPFDPELIEEDVRRLNRTGMFVDVKPFSQRVEGGRVVIFELYERPILHYVKYVGNQKVNKKKLAKEAEIKPGDAVDPFAVQEGRRRMEQYYHTHGFPKARVNVVEGDRPSDRGVVYLVSEGQKQRILWTGFEGNTIASDGRLRTQIQSKPGFLWLFKGQVNREQIDEDLDRLTAYYRSLGFFGARVGRELQFNEGQNWLMLTYVIDEGPRYAIRNVSFLGNGKFSTEELAAGLKLNGGEFFKQAEMQHDVLSIQDRYGSQGYVFARVKATPRFLDEPGQLDLVYNIQEGQRIRVGRILPQIGGEFPHTQLTTILDRMSLKPGDILDIRELRASERRLQASGLFEVDPAKGIQPRIVVNPPELKDLEAQVAGHSEGFRGQSPDPRPRTAWGSQRAGSPPPPSCPVDLILQGTWIGDPRPVEAPQAPGVVPGPPPPAPVRPIIRGQYSADAGRMVPSIDTGRYPSPTVQPAPSLLESAPPVGAYSGLPAVSSPGVGAPLPPNPQLPPPGSGPAGSRFFAQGPVSHAQPPTAEGVPSIWGNPIAEDPLLDVPLEPMVREAKTGRFMISVGVNSEAGLLGSIIIDEQNFDIARFPRSFQEIRDGTAWRGAGQRFRVEAVPGTEVQRYAVNFQEPYLLGTNISLGLSGYFYNRRYREWDEERVGGRVALGYRFTPDLSGVFAYRGAKINIYDPITIAIPELAEVVGDNALHGFQFRLTHDTRDSAFLATQGHLIELSYEQVTGSFNYPRGEVDLRKYFMLHQRPDGSGRHVLSLAGRMAVSGSDTPIYEHYYAGGFSTLRGFDFRSASPRDPLLGVTLGGHFMLLASAEYMFPITADDMIRGVVFCDSGTVEPAIDEWTDDYRVAPGFGLRIVIPAMGPAPIALDFAFPVSLESGDDVENFSFFVGLLR